MGNNENQGGYADDGVYYAKGTFDNATEYNNEIICLVNYTDEYFNAMDAPLSAKEFDEVATLLDAFQAQNEAAIEGLNALGAYNDDDRLVITAIAYVKELTAILSTDYKGLVNMIKEQTCTAQEYTAQRDQFSVRMQQITDMLEEAFETFSENHDQEEDDEDDFSGFEGMGGMHQGMEQVDFDPNNPLLHAVHGISLEDYAAAASKMASGMSDDQVASALGVERPQWDEANQLWQQRMQQDTEMAVIGLFGQYFATAENHPKFQNLAQDSSSAINQENLARIKVDAEYYFELSGAMQAAYSQGMDGAQWLREIHGLSIGEFQAVTMQWAQSPVFAAMIPFQTQKTKEYEAKFAKEAGGNIADDVEF